jgi:hypothetical protein
MGYFTWKTQMGKTTGPSPAHGKIQVQDLQKLKYRLKNQLNT